MRLLKFGVGLLLLRWLPFRFVTRWLLRFAVWGGLAYALIRRFKPELLSAPMQSVERPSEPSAWTAPAPPTPSPPPSPSPETSTAVQSETSTAPVSDLDEDAPQYRFGVASEDGGEIADATPLAEIAGDEMVDLVVSASIALEDVPPAETPHEPRWIRGDGSINCPPGFPIKGNADSEIFHVPGSRNYDRVIPEVCFATAEDALAAGYRAPFR